MGRSRDKNSIRSYFKSLFAKNPSWLKSKSNEDVYAQWQADHPGKQLTASIKSSISNIKNDLIRRRKSGKTVAEQPETPVMAHSAKAGRKEDKAGSVLEKLEFMIDEALLYAYRCDPAALSKVIDHLRRARNKVILAIGVVE